MDLMGHVKVTAVGPLKKRLSKGALVASGQTVGQAVENLQLGMVGGLPLTPVVNSQVVAWDYILKPDDDLELVPTIGGGC